MEASSWERLRSTSLNKQAGLKHACVRTLISCPFSKSPAQRPLSASRGGPTSQARRHGPISQAKRHGTSILFVRPGGNDQKTLCLPAEEVPLPRPGGMVPFLRPNGMVHQSSSSGQEANDQKTLCPPAEEVPTSQERHFTEQVNHETSLNTTNMHVCAFSSADLSQNTSTQ